MIVNSNQIGYNSHVSGFSGMAFGDGSRCAADLGVAIGNHAAVSGFAFGFGVYNGLFAGGICIGPGALNAEGDGNGLSVVIGTGASSYGGSAGANVIVGDRAYTPGGNNVIFGNQAFATGFQAVVLGSFSSGGQNSINIGSASHANDGAIAIGTNSYTISTGQCSLASKNFPAFVTGIGYGIASQGKTDGLTADGTDTLTGFGGYQGDPIADGDWVVVSSDGGSTWTDVPIGTYVVSASGPVLSVNVPAGTVSIAWSPRTPVMLAATSSDVSAFTIPDLGAPDLLVGGGQSVGIGQGGSVRIQTAFPGAGSGTTANPFVDRVYVNEVIKDLLVSGNNNPTDLFTIVVPNQRVVGGKVFYTISSTDGTDFQAKSGEIAWVAVADGVGAVTATAFDAADDAVVATAGTLTAATTLTPATNLLTLSITPASSITPTTLNITYTIISNPNSNAAVITIL